MPRPTAAQFVYGLCTVVLSTLAMLLLSQTSSGVGVAIIAIVALGLGLLVAVTVPLPRGARPSPEKADAGPATGSDAASGEVGHEVPAAPAVRHGQERRAHGGRRVRVP